MARLPARNELLIFKRAIEVFLRLHPEKTSAIRQQLADLDRLKTKPPGFCLLPSDIHAGLPQAARATGLLANWQNRAGRKYSEAVVHALALMGWMDIYYDGEPRNRTAYLHTRAGALLGDFRKDAGSTTLVARVSGAVRRRLGSDFVASAHAVFGRDFWSSPITTANGTTLPLRDFARVALKAARLLDT